MKFKKKSDNENNIKTHGFKNKKLISAVVTLVLIASCVLGVYFGGGFESLDYFLFYRHNVIDSAVTSTGDFSVNFANNDIISCENMSSKMIVLTKKMLTCISYKGRVLFTETFTFVEPQMYVNDNYGIVFDRGSSKYIVFDSYGIIRQGTTDDNRHIITAVTDKKGNCAISTKSNDSACRVYFLDKKGNTKYIWSCAEEYAVTLDISNDGNDILCGTLGSYNDEIYTYVYYLDIHSKRSEKSYKIKGSACLNVSFRDNNSAVVDCLDKRVILDLRTEDGSAVEVVFSGKTLNIARDENNNFAVVTDVPTADGGKEVALYDKNNSLVFRTTVPATVIDVLCNDDEVYCLTEAGIIKCDENGADKSFECDVIGKGLLSARGIICYYSSGRLIKAF